MCFAAMVVFFPIGHADQWFHAGLALWALHFAYPVPLPRFTRQP